jgi:hypothetical protein
MSTRRERLELELLATLAPLSDRAVEQVEKDMDTEIDVHVDEDRLHGESSVCVVSQFIGEEVISLDWSYGSMVGNLKCFVTRDVP